jgi:hypothetical protein
VNEGYCETGGNLDGKKAIDMKPEVKQGEIKFESESSVDNRHLVPLSVSRI